MSVSADIRGIFGRACDQLGIEWRPNNPWSLSVARRGSVALLDQFVGRNGEPRKGEAWEGEGRSSQASGPAAGRTGWVRRRPGGR
jgi:hypothetical protein